MVTKLGSPGAGFLVSAVVQPDRPSEQNYRKHFTNSRIQETQAGEPVTSNYQFSQFLGITREGLAGPEWVAGAVDRYSSPLRNRSFM